MLNNTIENKDLFDEDVSQSVENNTAYDHWIDMPEYNNINEPEAEITATFKFRNINDYEEFKEKAKKYIYDGDKLFDGSQTKTKKQAWYPLKEKASKYRYRVKNSKNPRFPIYIVSKGRFRKNPTSATLMKMNIPFYIIVEEQEYNEYCNLVGKDKVLILPEKYKTEYDTFWKDEDPRTGPGPARNFAWNHSIDNGFAWHWVMDDNIESFERFNKNMKINCNDGTYFYACEDFILRYTNIAIAGLNYANFCHSHEARPPFLTNTRIYSCLLIRNDIPYRWRGRYNEDTDLSLRVLKDGYCTVQFNALLQGKMATQKIKGGNTKEFYEGEGTMNKSKMLQDMHPDVAKVVWRFNRWHHHVDYKPFKKNKLILKDNIMIPNRINNYDMELINANDTEQMEEN
jgi:hypothetical protein